LLKASADPAAGLQVIQALGGGLVCDLHTDWTSQYWFVSTQV